MFKELRKFLETAASLLVAWENSCTTIWQHALRFKRFSASRHGGESGTRPTRRKLGQMSSLQQCLKLFRATPRETPFVARGRGGAVAHGG